MKSTRQRLTSKLVNSSLATDTLAKRPAFIPNDQQLSNLLRQQIASNRGIMGSLFKTVIFCGRNNIALKGRRDDYPSNENL